MDNGFDAIKCQCQIFRILKIAGNPFKPWHVSKLQGHFHTRPVKNSDSPTVKQRLLGQRRTYETTTPED
jgi:hypothetical protein